MNTLCAHNSKVSERITGQILDWYDTNARELPWRIPPADSRLGELPDPYFVWLSEIMLQQTQVVTVKSYFQAFITRWPTLGELANSKLDDVLKAWAGLGYYSRARNLKKCAEIIWQDHEGKFPENVKQLKELPGIGDYTSAAISAIAYNRKAVVIDGNVERVISRLHSIYTPVAKAKTKIHELTGLLVPNHRPGDFAQAMMDLGAVICTPKTPDCKHCPVRKNCMAYTRFSPSDFPVKSPKKVIPTRNGAAFVAINTSGEILLRKRQDKGMLAGMSEVPTSNWSSKTDGETGVSAAPFPGEWQIAGDVTHQFTHFNLVMKVYFCRAENYANVQGWWVETDRIMDEALPELMKKVIRKTLEKIR